uniref:50S ribosomal protein L33, chloroplastic n=1 Tax=Chlamydomonas euryale TaxID=1486919 RepID=A0A7R9VTB9_9CHLO|mmetsp:Transcript_44727/g.133626  ORF Transcript_44727/g.133626 Transcript_44727/m.133626 type:complete len:103 (+) Transcript_44727:65-373(+)
MNSLVKTGPSSVIKNPFLGSTLSVRVAAPVAKPTTANREVTTMAKKKGIRLIVTVECTEAKGEGGTPSRYCTQKNRKNTPERLEIKKYNPNLRRHTVHREIK